MARFFGRYEHSLDSKGRLILPAKFRHHFERGGYLSKYRDRCIALWTPEDFEKQMLAMEASSSQGKEERNLARIWAAGSQEVEIDRQGRLAVPPFLREYARFDADVLVNGAIDRVELWSPEEWQTKVAASEKYLTEEGD